MLELNLFPVLNLREDGEAGEAVSTKPPGRISMPLQNKMSIVQSTDSHCSSGFLREKI